MLYYFFFFFQAEDGIRDDLVTGVQTCALPIFSTSPMRPGAPWAGAASLNWMVEGKAMLAATATTAAAKVPDRKSTRLNSSHQIISYAVFCLKKKKNTITQSTATTRHPRSTRSF